MHSVIHESGFLLSNFHASRTNVSPYHASCINPLPPFFSGILVVLYLYLASRDFWNLLIWHYILITSDVSCSILFTYVFALRQVLHFSFSLTPSGDIIVTSFPYLPVTLGGFGAWVDESLCPSSPGARPFSFSPFLNRHILFWSQIFVPSFIATLPWS